MVLFHLYPEAFATVFQFQLIEVCVETCVPDVGATGAADVRLSVVIPDSPQLLYAHINLV